MFKRIWCVFWYNKHKEPHIKYPKPLNPKLYKPFRHMEPKADPFQTKEKALHEGAVAGEGIARCRTRFLG